MLHRRLAPVLCATLVAACAPAERDAPSLDIADVGFATPESALHDHVVDRYLVSNINGTPLDKDDNGFISRVRPDGAVETLKWIDGAAEGVTLHAPKGLGILGDTLFVADIDVVRLFHRESGAPLGERAVPGSTFLNDIAIGATGTVYVTDSGLDASFAPTGTDAVWFFADGRPVPLVQGDHLGRPNGITVTRTGVMVATFGTGELYTVLPSGEITGLHLLDPGQLDGVVSFADGTQLVSSWGASAVYRVAADGSATVVVDSVPSPADIGWDLERERVLVPIFSEDRLVVRRLD